MLASIRPLAAAAALTVCAPALALDFDFDLVDNPDQADFREVGQDLVALLNGKALTPAEPGGLLGFGIGVFASFVSTEDSNAWQRLVGEDVDDIGLVGVVAQKGLPLGIDVGASYAWVPGADGRVFGAEVRYALIEGGIAAPAVGLRGSYTKLSGIDDVDFDSYGVDLSISKGIGPLTPYAGAGYVWAELEAEPRFGLDKEDLDEPRYFIGARLSVLLGLTAEYERVGDRDAINVRLGLVF